jgi:hypothetical protein
VENARQIQVFCGNTGIIAFTQDNFYLFEDYHNLETLKSFSSLNGNLFTPIFRFPPVQSTSQKPLKLILPYRPSLKTQPVFLNLSPQRSHSPWVPLYLPFVSPPTGLLSPAMQMDLLLCYMVILDLLYDVCQKVVTPLLDTTLLDQWARRIRSLVILDQFIVSVEQTGIFLKKNFFFKLKKKKNENY